MTQSRPGLNRGLVTALTLATVTLGARSVVLAQGAVPADSSLAAKPTEAPKPWWQEKFAGSLVDFTTYVGTGTFYVSGYRNPYVSSALMLRPTYKLGTKYDLSLNVRVYLEEEYTAPDNSEARRFTPLDTWVWLAARNLYTMPASKIRFGGQVRAVIPTSYESRYQNTLTVLTAGGSASRPFEFGRPDKNGKKWELVTSLGTAFSKSLQTSIYRGNGPGDSGGCRAGTSLGGAAGAAGAGPDRCGGPINTNFTITTSATAALARGRWSLSTTLLLINQVRYATPDDDLLTAMNANYRGRSDLTWGIIALGYKINDHFGASLGLSSYQPALDSRYRYPRFPFYDFYGANANNFSQVFVGVNGSL